VLKAVRFLLGSVGSATLSPLSPLPLGGSLGRRGSLLSLLSPTATFLIAGGRLDNLSLGLGNSFRLAASGGLDGGLLGRGRGQGRIRVLGLLLDRLRLLGGVLSSGLGLGFSLGGVLDLSLGLVFVGITMLRTAGCLGVVDGREAGSGSGSRSGRSGGLVVRIVLGFVLGFVLGGFMLSGFLVSLVGRVRLLPLGEFSLVQLRPSLDDNQRQSRAQDHSMRGSYSLLLLRQRLPARLELRLDVTEGGVRSQIVLDGVAAFGTKQEVRSGRLLGRIGVLGLDGSLPAALNATFFIVLRLALPARAVLDVVTIEDDWDTISDKVEIGETSTRGLIGSVTQLGH
jgi:hypothetical protein